VAEMAASRKEAKYATLQFHYDFQPIAVETLGPVNESATCFLCDLGRRISLVSGEDTARASVFVSAHFSHHPALQRGSFA